MRQARPDGDVDPLSPVHLSDSAVAGRAPGCSPSAGAAAPAISDLGVMFMADGIIRRSALIDQVGLPDRGLQRSPCPGSPALRTRTGQPPTASSCFEMRKRVSASLEAVEVRRWPGSRALSANLHFRPGTNAFRTVPTAKPRKHWASTPKTGPRMPTNCGTRDLSPPTPQQTALLTHHMLFELPPMPARRTCLLLFLLWRVAVLRRMGGAESLDHLTRGRPALRGPPKNL